LAEPTDSSLGMRIVAALFMEGINLREAEGGATRIDLTGVKFSEAAAGPFPVSLEPHLVVLVHNPPGAKDSAALEVTYHREGEQVARNVQLLQVEPGKFSYRLVRAELTFDAPGTVEARCRIDGGDPLTVPFTLLAPVS
jgi:hypothetical protein